MYSVLYLPRILAQEAVNDLPMTALLLLVQLLCFSSVYSIHWYFFVAQMLCNRC